MKSPILLVEQRTSFLRQLSRMWWQSESLLKARLKKLTRLQWFLQGHRSEVCWMWPGMRFMLQVDTLMAKSLVNVRPTASRKINGVSYLLLMKRRLRWLCACSAVAFCIALVASHDRNRVHTCCLQLRCLTCKLTSQDGSCNPSRCQTKSAILVHSPSVRLKLFCLVAGTSKPWMLHSQSSKPKRPSTTTTALAQSWPNNEHEQQITDRVVRV